MTQQQHTFTPPPELVQQWTDEIYGGPGVVAASDDICLAKLAAQWGADQELEECAQRQALLYGNRAADELRAARRPKPPTLKQQALNALQRYISGETVLIDASIDTIRLALEQLPDD